jgi:hypothetical protein
MSAGGFDTGAGRMRARQLQIISFEDATAAAVAALVEAWLETQGEAVILQIDPVAAAAGEYAVFIIYTE